MRRVVLCMVAALSLLAAHGQEKPVQGWVFTPMPNLGFSTDTGVTLGAYSDFFYYGDGSCYPNFLHHAGISAAYATKGSWYVHAYFESPSLVDGLRVSATATYRDAMVNNFFGFNGIASPYVAALDMNAQDRIAWYTNRKRFFRASASVQGDIAGRLFWMGGAVFRRTHISDFSLERYDSGHSLYLAYRDAGLIRQDEASGGSSLELKGGLLYDSRDVELSPGRGAYGELYLLANGDLGRWKYNYGQLVAHFRHYLSLVPERIIFAYHLGLQHQLWGEMPFYYLNEIASVFYAYDEISGLGSRLTVRGLRYNRIAAAGYAWGNFELRLIPFRFHLWGRDINIILNPFADVCAITRNYRLPEQMQLPAFYQERRLPVMAALGLGGKLQMNTNFILSLDVGRGLEPQLSEWTVGMATTYVF